MLSNRVARAVGVALAVSVLAVATSAGDAFAARRGSFRLAGIHKWAAEQPTAAGRQIVDLQVHAGRVYAGYGDYDANTGPITIASLGPAGDFTPHETIETEAAYVLREVGGRLVVPSTDPRGASPSDYTDGAQWKEHLVVRASHVFDSASITGNDLWLVGSQGRDAVAWRSLDDGATWTESLRVSPASGEPSDWSRFYFAGTLGSRLYVQAIDAFRGPQDSSMVFDGSAWTAAPSLLPHGGHGARPFEFNGELVYQGMGEGRAGDVYGFDGSAVRTIGRGYDVVANGGGLYLLDEQGTVKTSRDSHRWSRVARAPRTARSLAVSESAVYVGTADAEVWVTEF